MPQIAPSRAPSWRRTLRVGALLLAVAALVGIARQCPDSYAPPPQQASHERLAGGAPHETSGSVASIPELASAGFSPVRVPAPPSTPGPATPAPSSASLLIDLQGPSGEGL